MPRGHGSAPTSAKIAMGGHRAARNGVSGPPPAMEAGRAPDHEAVHPLLPQPGTSRSTLSNLTPAPR